MYENDRIDVDSLELGVRTYPLNSYIGGELTALRAKSADNPLIFHLSIKTRQGRSTIVVQCGKFPVDLDGTGVLEEVHEFLEKRFRQHIRLQADAGDLEIVEIVRQRGNSKRIVIRYGFGGTLFAQDGSQVYLKGGKTGLDRSGLYCTRPDHLFSSQCPAGSPRKIRQKKTPSNHPQSCLCQSPLPLKTVPSPRFPSARRQVNPQYLLERRFLQK